MTDQPTPCGPVPEECDAEAGEPCGRHEAEQAHAEGEHAFCGNECHDQPTTDRADADTLHRAAEHARNNPDNIHLTHYSYKAIAGLLNARANDLSAEDIHLWTMAVARHILNEEAL